MQLKTVVKIGTIVSVLLFCLAVGFYAFMRLDMAERNRDVNLYSLVPSNCVGVLESNRIHGLLDDYSMLNYNRELKAFQFPGLFEFLLSELDAHNTGSEHGQGNRMDHLLVSFHQPVTSRNQVVYFRMGSADEQLLSDIFQGYTEGNFLPKEEKYRGKTILVYPLAQDEFIAAYTEKGFYVVSYQKRLIEEVIDAQLDDHTLSDDDLFVKMMEKKKSADFMTLYSRVPCMPFLETGGNCWNEFDFHMNSDVVYLTGETYVEDTSSVVEKLFASIQEIPMQYEENWLVSSVKDSTAYYMNLAYDAHESGSPTLFDECVANLSNEATFSMVVDMQRVVEEPKRYQSYLSPFILENAPLFQSFILSAQFSMNENRLSHLWTFTYKY